MAARIGKSQKADNAQMLALKLSCVAGGSVKLGILENYSTMSYTIKHICILWCNNSSTMYVNKRNENMYPQTIAQKNFIECLFTTAQNYNKPNFHQQEKGWMNIIQQWKKK